MKNINQEIMKTRIIVVDPDEGRRSQLASIIRTAGHSYEPCASPDELFCQFPENGIIFAHDGEGLLNSILHYSANRDIILPVAAYACSPRTSNVVDAVFSGAIDYFHFPIKHEDVNDRINLILERFDRIRIKFNRSKRSMNLINVLTLRERQIVELMVIGLKSKEISEKLGISVRTVEIHRGNLMKKIGVRQASDVVKIAVDAGLF